MSQTYHRGKINSINKLEPYKIYTLCFCISPNTKSVFLNNNLHEIKIIVIIKYFKHIEKKLQTSIYPLSECKWCLYLTVFASECFFLYINQVFCTHKAKLSFFSFLSSGLAISCQQCVFAMHEFMLWIYIFDSNILMGFPHSSVGKESACNAGALGSIPG